jgi:CDP-diacylglycerol--serine O-phosphatidyltransferase
MDHMLPRLEDGERRRRRRLLFRHSRIPVRMLVPNFFTLLSLCAGLTAIRMAIELRYEYAIGLVVVAALLDGVDGRLARALRAQSRFGAELDSLADFVNFGVAPAVIVFIWGLVALPRGLGWIVAMVFAIATGLRLARFNTMLEVEKPKWQAAYFTGMPAPAGAITVLLPLYLDGVGLDIRTWPWFIAIYTMAMAGLLVSTIPTFSGKLLGERIARENVRPAFVGAAALVALLLTYPYGTLTVVTVLYLCAIPISYRRFQQEMREPVPQAKPAVDAVHLPGEGPAAGDLGAGETKH